MADFNEVIKIVESVMTDFNNLNTEQLNFKKECEFALQQIESNDALFNAAVENPRSLKNAILNVAAIGLSLNPAEKLAYLVPRKGKVCLDDSYMGKIKLGTDSGSIKWANAELVYSNDTFIYKGHGIRPLHEFDPFGNRGTIKGAYAVAETHDGTILIEVMSMQEIEKIRNNTDSYKGYLAKKAKGDFASSVWVDHPEAQIKKTVIRRAYKFWPKTKRLAESQRIESENYNQGNAVVIRDTINADPTVIDEIKKFLVKRPEWEKRLLDHMTNKTQGKIIFTSVNSFKQDEAEYALSVLKREDASESEIQQGDQ